MLPYFTSVTLSHSQSHHQIIPSIHCYPTLPQSHYYTANHITKSRVSNQNGVSLLYISCLRYTILAGNPWNNPNNTLLPYFTSVPLSHSQSHHQIIPTMHCYPTLPQLHHNTVMTSPNNLNNTLLIYSILVYSWPSHDITRQLLHYPADLFSPDPIVTVSHAATGHPLQIPCWSTILRCWSTLSRALQVKVSHAVTGHPLQYAADQLYYAADLIYLESTMPKSVMLLQDNLINMLLIYSTLAHSWHSHDIIRQPLQYTDLL